MVYLHVSPRRCCKNLVYCVANISNKHKYEDYCYTSKWLNMSFKVLISLLTFWLNAKTFMSMPVSSANHLRVRNNWFSNSERGSHIEAKLNLLKNFVFLDCCFHCLVFIWTIIQNSFIIQCLSICNKGYSDRKIHSSYVPGEIYSPFICLSNFIENRVALKLYFHWSIQVLSSKIVQRQYTLIVPSER